MNKSNEIVLAALSGGVDSSVAALLAQRAGYTVVGATLDMTPEDPVLSTAWSCGGAAMREAVGALGEKLGIAVRFLSCARLFEEKILRPCAAEYAAGRTPNPCCRCNELLKFGLLAELATELGAVRLITGHYARFGLFRGERVMMRGSDPAKDQSYFLYRLPRRVLEMLDFPLGALQKSAVRALAAEAGLPTAQKPDSQDACFHFPGESFPESLARHCASGGGPVSGRFVYGGRTVGRHEGIRRYTVGQRKGLNVALGRPAYIRAIDATTGDIELVTDPGLLATARFRVTQCNWHVTAPPYGEPLSVQIRYRSPATAGRVSADGVVELERPVKSVTPGQAAVFYCDGALLGGGIIEL